MLAFISQHLDQALDGCLDPEELQSAPEAPGEALHTPPPLLQGLLWYFGQQVQDRCSGPFLVEMDLPDNHQFKPRNFGVP